MGAVRKEKIGLDANAKMWGLVVAYSAWGWLRDGWQSAANHPNPYFFLSVVVSRVRFAALRP